MKKKHADYDGWFYCVMCRCIAHWCEECSNEENMYGATTCNCACEHDELEHFGECPYTEKELKDVACHGEEDLLKRIFGDG